MNFTYEIGIVADTDCIKDRNILVFYEKYVKI